MSQARVYTTKGPVRKDGLKCGRCGDPIVKGKDQRRTFAVGFRGYEQTRCMKQECYPTRAELESSAVADVYAAIDGADLSSASSLEDLEAIRDEIAQAFNDVADEYDSNEMIEINYDLQERRDMLQNSASEIESWAPEDDEPTEEDEVSEEDERTFEERHEEWLDAARTSLDDLIGSVDIP